jgi:hypothetical protein
VTRRKDDVCVPRGFSKRTARRKKKEIDRPMIFVFFCRSRLGAGFVDFFFFDWRFIRSFTDFHFGLHSAHCHHIRITSPFHRLIKNTMASWEWKSADGWIQYDYKCNKKIIKAAKNNKTSVEITLASGARYLIDLVNNRQIQKNAPTKTRRVRYNDGSLPRTVPKVGTSPSLKHIEYTMFYHNHTLLERALRFEPLKSEL